MDRKKRQSLSSKKPSQIEELNQAIRERNKSKVNRILKSGQSVIESDSKGNQPLRIAANFYDPYIFKKIVKSGSVIDAENSDVGFTALFLVSMAGNINAVRVLLQNGADVNKTVQNMSPLMIASSSGAAEVVQELLKAGADVHFGLPTGDTALHLVLQFDKSDMGIKQLTNIITFEKDNHVTVLEELVKAGADVNSTRNDGATALHIASLKGHDQIVRKLLELNANVNHTDNAGQTPIMFASQEGHVTVFDDLVKAHADVNITNNEGATALDIATSNGHDQIVQKLLEINAVPDQSEQ